MIRYVTTETKCRSLQLLEYFGETNKMRCGNCDVCRKRDEIGVNTLTFDYIVDDLKRIIGSQSASIQEILSQTSHNENDVISVIIICSIIKK
jgi:ATP-dependent DNA helicase RecQ